MAAINLSPSGFSYAQAAKGRTSAATSQTPPSKVTSGAATPATGTFSELTPGSNWADDVEASVGSKKGEAQKAQQEENKNSQSKESAVERAKTDDKLHNSTSGVSSPDLAASSSTTTKEDDASSAPNGSSSETTWDTKSQTSEPSWIAEREKRQNGSQASESTATADKQSKEMDAVSSPPSTPVVLQEAPPPMVNPWQKRAEEAKAKMAAMPKPAPVTQASDTSVLKENQKPRADSRKKANSIASVPRESLINTGDESRKPNGFQGKRANDVRGNSFRQNSKTATEESRPDSAAGGPTKAAVTREHQSLPNMSIPPPSVRDEVSWPTPDTAQEKERKDSSEKDAEVKQDDDTTPTTKRKKQEWKVIPVVPTVIWETQSMNEPKDRKSRGPSNGDRGGRNGNGYRGRGGYRGAPNGTNGGDRQSSQTSSSPNMQKSDVPVATRSRSNTADAEAMPPPFKPSRASSAGAWREQKPEKLPGGSTNGQIFTASGSSEGASSDTAKAASPTNGVAKPFSDARRTKSPKHMNAAGSEQKDEEVMPTPIPRRNSVGTQTEKVAGGNENASRDVPPIRMVLSESRKEPRNLDNFREPTWNGSTRGSKRGGRGRGGGNGVRELPNGHPAGHAYGNSYSAEFDAASTFEAVPPSPSFSTGGRGNHQVTYPPPGRGGWARGNPRSQSIPVDNSNNYYNRFAAAQFGNAQQLAPLQTYGPGMYDFNGYPMTAMMYPPQGDLRYLIEMVNTQIEYYFSMENLFRDVFLRKHMDSQGYVFLDVIATFRRLQSLTQDKDIVKHVCIDSELIEIRVGDDGKERLRKREGWEQFVLPMGEREQSAQNEGPKHLERPERPQLSFGGAQGQYRGPASAGVTGTQSRFDRRAYDSMYPMMNGYAAPFPHFTGVPEGMYGEMLDGEEARGRAAKPPIHDSSTSPSKQPFAGVVDANDTEDDAFPDHQASILTVVVRTNEPKAPYHSAASRTFSDGSIDSRSILSETQQPTETPSRMGRDILTNGTTNTLSLSRQASSNTTRSSERGVAADTDLAFLWMKDQDMPVEFLPPNSNPEPYVQLRLKALDQRNHAATGTCPYDLDVLYQFWCHFLLRNFNNRMYSEFKHFAHEDARERHNATGLQNLLRYYSRSLLSQKDHIRDRVCKDYVELVKSEPPLLEGAAFKQLRSAWRNGALFLKNRKKLADIVDEQLKERLDKKTEG